ncbi:2-oxoglutarate dehydrogenase complex dihydrolipoyllysine-residue succinyltransferase [Bacillaceae bacterium SIJ1]|uniref:2-oxoglutarate dehydrogenase complex dihydrolipoyllysine-residue succinyltransferase n=1 Tax=Litoribacterium kuwaitense TaxID=1398745 RepID=UPI0013EB1009|nr:2-oxoglutarate dehydrogenase complex dihydrolipoyllysine-residue succinyltransferase [Litoribacterium kuwaitense]NGP44007.1 2-oxoglutarate dehydrogenase complex dihydrolipoyllysine-residue succinyltransferase [Litoribacterium kuwaitense]
MTEIKVPELAESITEGTIAQWLKQVGDQVEQGEAVLELETDKVNIEVNSEHSGVLQEQMKQPGDTVEVGEVVAMLGEGSADSAAPKAEEAPAAPKEETAKPAEEKPAAKEDTEATSSEKPVASPAARKRARELGIDLNEVQSRDPLGRVRTEDVERQAASKNQPKPAAKEASAPKAQQPTNPDKPVERIPMSRRRQTIAKHLVEAQHTAAMLTTFNEVDLTKVMDLRKRRKQSFQDKHDVRLGFMSFFTKAVVGALKEFPMLNAEIQGNEILKKQYYDIGIAVAATEGLVVPVVRNADRLSFAQIEREINTLAGKAKDNTLQLKDLQGGSFTITNGGVFGSLVSTPILNAPQVGILGMHTIQRRPVVVDDQDTVEVRPMMYIALSYDHRIVDGSTAVQFLVTIKNMLEDPEQLLLEG